MKKKHIEITDEEAEASFLENNRLAVVGMILPFLAVALVALAVHFFNRFSKKERLARKARSANREEPDHSGSDKTYAYLR